MSNIIVAGGRDFGNRRRPGHGQDSAWYESCWFHLKAKMNKIVANDDVIFTGGAKGADELGAQYASYSSLGSRVFKANWDKYGKSAGPVRNCEMAKSAHVLVAFWDGQSPGTKHMIDTALARGLEVHVFPYEKAKE